VTVTLALTCSTASNATVLEIGAYSCFALASQLLLVRFDVEHCKSQEECRGEVRDMVTLSVQHRPEPISSWMGLTTMKNALLLQMLVFVTSYSCTSVFK